MEERLGVVKTAEYEEEYTEMQVFVPEEIIQHRPDSQVLPTGNGPVEWEIVENYVTWRRVGDNHRLLKITIDKYPGYPLRYRDKVTGMVTEAAVSDAINVLVDKKVVEI